MGVKGGFGKMNTLPQGRFSFRGGKLCNGTVSRIIVCTVLKQKDGSMYQPIFTDMIEFTRFAQGKKMKTAAIPADKIPEILIPDAKGVAINPFGVNVRLDITKANKQKPEA